MKYRRKLFRISSPYKKLKNQNLFINAIKENVAYNIKHCNAYRELLDYLSFDINELKTDDDVIKVPPIPTAYLKTTPLFSIPFKKCFIKSQTSGTSGQPTRVGLNKSSCYYGGKMLLGSLIHHKMFSLRFHNYLILGFKPSKTNKMGAAKTAYGCTFLTPALNKVFAIKEKDKQLEPDFENVIKHLKKFEKQKLPVRIIGFPAYAYFLIQEMQKLGLKVKLHPKSKIFLGGGWKQFSDQKIDKSEFTELINKTFGITNIHEFFGVVEHNIPYFSCKNNHFHIPNCSKVIIRHPTTLAPLPFGQPGLLNLISPLVNSMPLTSIITDDLAIMHDGSECGCGHQAPFFEILGRVGHGDIKTCVNKALDLLGGN